MGGGQMETPRGWQADTGQEGRYATAAGTCKLARTNGRAKHSGVYYITPESGETFTIEAKGREAWALDRLRLAGTMGCTPITEPAPRWSAYVHKLRARGVPIETVHEPHGGAYAGTHGRYVLRATVQRGGRHD